MKRVRVDFSLYHRQEIDLYVIPLQVYGNVARFILKVAEPNSTGRDGADLISYYTANSNGLFSAYRYLPSFGERIQCVRSWNTVKQGDKHV